jgi:hypothetical protein
VFSACGLDPHSVAVLCDARIIIKRWLIACPGARKGTLHGTADFSSHQTDRWTLHLLQRGRSGRRAGASPVTRTSPFVADVRASLRPAFRSLSPCRAGLSRFRTQRLAGPEKIRVYLRSLRRDYESLHGSAWTAELHTLYAGFTAGPWVFAWP